MSSLLIKEKAGSWLEKREPPPEGGGRMDLAKIWERRVEGNFRTLVLDAENRVLASGEAMLFPSLGLGAFYPDSPEVLAQVSDQAKILLRMNGLWIGIRNLKPRQELASLPRVYFEWDGD